MTTTYPLAAVLGLAALAAGAGLGLRAWPALALRPVGRHRAPRRNR